MTSLTNAEFAAMEQIDATFAATIEAGDALDRAEATVRDLVKLYGEVEPRVARMVADVPATTFNAAVRLLKRMGCVEVTGAGLLAGW